ncbi:MAG: hypothetical protein JWR06_86, partial [Jatrophihabitans sp.]|nr:hypothetical protein [Jatrophihabitans sp.]
LSSRGYQTRHVSLNDGGIWVTSDKDGLFGRLNKPAGSLDLALNPSGGAQSSYALDVRQQGAAVAAWDKGTGRLLPVNVTDGQVLTDQQIPVSESEQVEVNGGTLAVLDPATNRVWATHLDPNLSITSLAAVDPSARPVIKFAAGTGAEAAQGASLSVGPDGTVYAVTAGGDVGVVHPDGETFTKATYSKLHEPLRSVQVTAVGSSMVVLDAVQGTLVLPGGQTATIKGDPDARLQTPSPDGTSVAVATTSQLVSVPLAGGRPISLFDGGVGKPAAPTRFGDCVHSAWAGNPGVYARACGGGVGAAVPLPHNGALQNPVFRINRGSILLNDLTLGSIYDLDALQEVDNWTAVKPPPIVKQTKENKKNNTSVASRDLPPKAVDDTLGARPGRTTTLHVLDNDSDPQGAILSITRVTGLDQSSAKVTTSPDGQSVQISLPSGVAAAHFKYTVDDGKGLTASASVTVAARSVDQNTAPALRRGFKQAVFSVSAGGTLELPVLDDWRDYDGDPLVVSSAKVSAGRVTTTPDGRLNYLAPATGGTQTITYDVADGVSAPTSQRIPVTVLGPTATNTAPPVAQPDTARGEVGHPITIQPLANDLPGADPTNPNAALALAGTLASPAGVRVSTDLKSNTVTVTASRHGTFTLSYNAAYGNAKFSAAKIRVDVANAPPAPQPPVAVPDTGVLYGQTATTIDVLANDFDPAGGVLVVQHAAPAVANDQLHVAIVDGHWLRIEAANSNLSPNPQVVSYTITDGLTDPVTGEVAVTQVDPPADDSPAAVDDYATVRSGDSGLIPVMDNDIDPAGAALSLLDDVAGAPRPGQLVATNSEGTPVGAGTAYISGKQVRYAAPAVTQETTNTITYVVHNASGARATGTVHVTVMPPPSAKNPDEAPAPQPINARAVSGATITVKIPTSGIDPDGDTTTVAGITSAPKLGRIVSIGATTITYEAFPTKSGTDRFGYLVSDPYGKTASSIVNVGVATPSDPQPPVAVADSITASPGAKVRVDALANDVIAPGDNVAITDLGKVNPDLPPGNTLRGPSGPIQVVAPGTDGRSQVVLYSLSDGIGQPSTAAVTVHSQRGYVPPPIAVDATATPKPNATTVTVDVLKKAADPQDLPITVAKVFDARATVSGPTVRLPVLDRVQNVLYEIRNSQGGTAAAVIHVPARGVGAPYARAGKLITIDRNGSRTIAIADYALDPAGKPLRLTTTDRLNTAPESGLRLTSPDTTHLTLTGTNGYVGPAAITFQVSDGKALNDPAAETALITVQVQVGPDTPVLRCPSAPINVIEGGPDNVLDVAALCHVWTANPADRDRLRFRGTWHSQPHDVEVVNNGSHDLTLRAHAAAKPGDSGSLSIGVDGSSATPSTINVSVVKLGRPSMNAVSIDGVKAATTVRRDIRGYLTSPLRDPKNTVVSITQVAGMPATATKNGSTFSITPAQQSHGQMRFALVVSDVADTARTDRQVSGRVSLDVLNVPDAPGAPQAGRTILSRTVVLSWSTPPANGAPIDSYQVQWSGGSQSCPASPCRITGLVNGSSYGFTVRAHNAVGYGKPSPRLAPPAKPNTLPGAVGHITTSNPQDGRLTVLWSAAQNQGSAILQYRVSWSGGGARTVSGGTHTIVAGGLTNDNVYTFTVVAVNALGAGPPTTTRGQSAGVPPVPTGMAVSYSGGAGTTARVVKVQWNPADPNGAGPTTYTATRDGTPICAKTQATSCTDTPATAHTYTYKVVAQNAVGHQSAAASTQFRVTGTPDPPTLQNARATDTDGQVQLTYTVPDSHGQSSTIQCTSSAGSCGTWAPGAGPGATDNHLISGLSHDTDFSFTLKDCNEEQCGAPSASASAHTSGVPHAPSASCSQTSGGVHFTWSPPADYNGHSIRGFLVSIDGGGYGAETSARNRDVGGQDGNTHRINVKAVDNRGEVSTGSGSASCTDPPPPDPRTVKISMGAYHTASDCTHGCHYIVFTVSGFAPNTRYNIHVVETPGTYVRDYPFTTNGSGDYGPKQTTGYYGGPGGSPPGYGRITGTVAGVSGSCYGNWKDGGPCS